MPKVLLFASLAEAAGCREFTFDGDTISEILRSAEKKFGERFTALLTSASIVVNGERVTSADAVSMTVKEQDEVALLPPVGGGYF